MFVIDGGLPLSGEFQITSLPVVPAEGEVSILPFPMPGDDGVVTIQPYPLPGDDGVVSILPFPMPGDDGVVTFLPFPTDEMNFMPVFDEGFFNLQPLNFDFDFSVLSIGNITLPAIDWATLLPADLTGADGFGFQSFVFNTEGGITLTLLDGSFYTVELDQLAAISFPAIEEGRLAVDPSTLTGALLDGFNAGWI